MKVKLGDWEWQGDGEGLAAFVIFFTLALCGGIALVISAARNTQ